MTLFRAVEVFGQFFGHFVQPARLVGQVEVGGCQAGKCGLFDGAQFQFLDHPDLNLVAQLIILSRQWVLLSLAHSKGLFYGGQGRT